MSPIEPDPIDIIGEAQRIKHELLAVEAAVAKVTQAARDKQLKTLPDRLNYDNGDSTDTNELIDTRIAGKLPVITPIGLAEVLPVTKKTVQTTLASRMAITDIINHQDNRLFVIVGPCSLHDPKSALEYAKKVVQWRQQFGDQLEVVMRAYMEKPRTEKDWKGLVYDPLLDNSEDINLGVVVVRLLASQITNMGVPIAMERLNALTPQFVNSLVAYDTIGARNILDQKAREYASGTSSPVGFKNSIDGSIVAAIQAILSARAQHAFLGVSLDGLISQINTTGNTTGHVVLRGDHKGPNYSASHIAHTKALLSKANLPQSIVIDASHGNSQKVAAKQIIVVKDVAAQVSKGETAIAGVMIESHLVAGAQKLKESDGSLKNAYDLAYGKSITDECVGLVDTEAMLQSLSDAVVMRRK